MAQKNETTVLIISLLFTLSLVGGGIWWLRDKFIIDNDLSSNSSPSASLSPQSNTSPSPEQIPLSERLSFGEKLLIPSTKTAKKQAAASALAAQNYNKAIESLEASLKAKRNDPEALIYLNNARIGNNKSYAIAVSIPVGDDENAAQELLRGVAQAQNEINAQGGIKGVPLKVLIANDDNDGEIAQEVGQEFVNNASILAVIGHFGSGTTLEAAEKVYQPQGLVMISPTSTSVALSGVGNYIFRTVPSDRFAGDALAQYMLKKMKKTKAAVFFNSESNYSKSLKDVFTTTVFGDGGEVVGEFDLVAPNFNAVQAVQQAKEQGAEVLMLAMNTSTLNPALWVIQSNNGDLPLLGGDSAYKPEILKLGGKDAQGMVIAVPWHILENPNAVFPQKARQLWGGDVNWRTAMAYDATQALIAALGVNPTRKGIQETLSSPSFSAAGAARTIRFLPSGDRNQQVQLVIVQPGTRSSYGYDFVPIPE
jgi:branched-chain amino acid transport system substrate-binding protein